MDENLHSPHRQLIELRIEHADLDDLIDRFPPEGAMDDLALRRLKKRRLWLRDQIACLERSLDPPSPPEVGLLAQVREAFASDGPLMRADAAYRRRVPQERMALAVAHALDEGHDLVVEAGTGVGKTFAYLVPLLMAGRRALVSTATKTLQDQLFLRDLPRLKALLGVPARLALLKGRASYLCLHRMPRARQDLRLADSGALVLLARVEAWAASTHTGDLGEVEGSTTAPPSFRW